jgi:hypothetical protein
MAARKSALSRQRAAKARQQPRHVETGQFVTGTTRRAPVAAAARAGLVPASRLSSPGTVTAAPASLVKSSRAGA